MTSTKAIFPIEYYDLYDWCQSIDGRDMNDQNFIQFLSGDRIENSPYLLMMKTDMYCEQL